MLRRFLGASSGIGEGAAKLFAAEQCSLALAGRNEANLLSVKQECTNLGGKEIEIFIGDATDEFFLKRLVAGVLTHFGRLDILVSWAK